MSFFLSLLSFHNLLCSSFLSLSISFSLFLSIAYFSSLFLLGFFPLSIFLCLLFIKICCILEEVVVPYSFLSSFYFLLFFTMPMYSLLYSFSFLSSLCIIFSFYIPAIYVYISFFLHFFLNLCPSHPFFLYISLYISFPLYIIFICLPLSIYVSFYLSIPHFHNKYLFVDHLSPAEQNPNTLHSLWMITKFHVRLTPASSP